MENTLLILKFMLNSLVIIAVVLRELSYINVAYRVDVMEPSGSIPRR